MYWVEVYPRATLAHAAGGGAGRRRPGMREQLFERVPSVIMTSATLAIGGEASFDFFKSRVGLTQAAAQALGSPFDYQRQATLVLLRGVPDPSSEKAAVRAPRAGIDTPLRARAAMATLSCCSPITRCCARPPPN